MADVVQKLNILESLPRNLHLFCPRSDEGEEQFFYDEDLGDKVDTETEEARNKRKKAITAAEERRDIALGCTLIWAYDGDDAATYGQKLKDRLTKQLMSCEVCIRVYHQGRQTLKSQLGADYGEDEVTRFLEVFDDISIHRITEGLGLAAREISNLPPEKHHINYLSQQALFSVFEALSSPEFLTDEKAMSEHFDDVFKQVQTKRRLKLNVFVPAMTTFLFSSNDARAEWAIFTWTKMKRSPTKLEFDWAIRTPLHKAMLHVQMYCLEVPFLPAFWQGARLIIERLKKDLITHSLRALDIDIYRLALEHLSVDSDCFPELIGAIKVLLVKSPKDFWEAMGAVSTSTFAEQIFKNKYLNRQLLGTLDSRKLGEYFGWVQPVIESIKPTNLGPLCDTLASQFLGRFQSDEFAHSCRSHCQLEGMTVLLLCLEAMNKTFPPISSTPGVLGNASVAHALRIVDSHAHVILETISGNNVRGDMLSFGLNVVEEAIRLDCLSLKATGRQLEQGKPTDAVIDKNDTLVWKPVVAAIKEPQIGLPGRTLLGSSILVGLEPFKKKNPSEMTKEMRQFNDKFDTLSQHICDVLYKLSEFSPSHLDHLFEDSELASGVLSHLFSSGTEPYQGVVELMKVVSGKDTRSEALNHFLQAFYSNTVSCISGNLKRIIDSQVFAPTPTLLKICADMVENLCNSQNGLLRSQPLSREEATATETFWRSLWSSLLMIFERTEQWSQLGYDKNMMIEYCRDTMQLAEDVFDQYSIFVSAIAAATSSEKKDVHRRLIFGPTRTYKAMVKWLRLRDEFLITKSVSLTSKLLRRLKGGSVEVDDRPLIYVGEVITGVIKSNLSAIQKVEIQTALEAYYGKPFQAPQDEIARNHKQKTIGSFFKSEPRFSESRAASTVSSDNEDFSGIAAYRAKEAQRKKSAALPTRPSKLKETTQSEFMKKRQAEKQAQERQRAAAIAKARQSSTKSVEKGTGIYVSSESEGDDELDAALFGISKKPKKERITPDNKLRDTMAGLPQGPIKVQKRVRSAKDMRARLAPDLSPLHKEILGWDYFHDGDFPPKSESDLYQQVSDSFDEPSAYTNAFRPLLLLEAWQGFVKAREEGGFKAYEIKVVTRSSVDAFQEFSTTMSQNVHKDVGLSEGDVVLCSKDSNPSEAAHAAHCLARVYRMKRQKGMLEVSYRVLPGNKLQSSLNPGSLIWAVKVQSITPLEREFGALSGLQFYDLCDEIIQAKPSPLLSYSDKILRPIMSNYTVNTAQAKAVQSAIDNDAFTLIQGPPGSGKTKTIVAIVGALLSENGSARPKTITASATNGSLPQRSLNTVAKKLLVCAPSNAAVDELVIRFKDGIRSMSGQHRKVNVVRLGRSDAINASIKDVTLDELVSAKLGVTANTKGREDGQKVFKEHSEISAKLREARLDLDKVDTGEIKGDEAKKAKDNFDNLRRRKAQLSNQIESFKDAEKNLGREAELNRKRAQQQVLDEAHIICATLSGSGHDMFQSLSIEFETVVVDEAAQCVEMSAIIPLKYGCSKCILVGDPKQLPPTVFSKQASRFQYERSLFVRMQGNHPDAVHLLDTQYRMHPEISAFPSASFYDGRLLDGADMASLRKRPWHDNPILGPYRFFDVKGQHSAAPKGHSLINIEEINFALQLYDMLNTTYRGGFDIRGKVGIITPYKSQLRELKSRFSRRYGEEILENVEFNTTDAFQGRESEIIIFSCVRASPSGGVGFLQDIRRMNVGLTRAKSSLWVLGNSQSLSRGEYWNKLLHDAKKRDRYTDGNLAQAIKSAESKSAKGNHSQETLPNASGDGQARALYKSTLPKSDSLSHRSSETSMQSAKIKKENKNVEKREPSLGDHDNKPARIKTEARSESPMDIDILSDLNSHLAGGASEAGVKQDVPEPKIKTEQNQNQLTRPRVLIKKRKDVDPFMPKQNKKPRPT
ncbi:hypothetical protein EJ05DRAFT_533967 [Pseudovirgaria hyperparasitica]|uniref:tRNA-splicing endonuclease-like protein n=1 Tax=Pseudovirgaria hyperparasitica TaxID=470096 RepID=A0A6A6WHW7_9PEZI|nr:uncharacterized protein EJ05DRAFT_533967 [Pseudovirgaria hyperparasitica]KAF2762403.1 hypothetical protein EJ05DRAFT_533967 [Pseudovirgaria hyperparasitica]